MSQRGGVGDSGPGCHDALDVRPSCRVIGELSDRVALITGAAGDIGRAVAVSLVARGADLLLTDRPGTTEALSRTARRCHEVASDRAIERLEFDVTDAEDVVASLAPLQPDLLVNSAGYQGEFAPVHEYPIDDLRLVADVNLVGTFAVLQAVARSLIDLRRPGAIVNIASMAGVGGPPNMPAYAASKAAVIGLTMSAAKDLAPHGIRVNAVSPGFIGEGTMWERQISRQAAVTSPYYSSDPERVESEMIDQIPLGRAGTLEEVSSVVAFLLSDAAAYLTGVNIEIAGGAS